MQAILEKIITKITFMIERLSLFIEYLNISINAFESKINSGNGTIRKAIAKNTDIQSKWISAITENYPQLNILWLLTGKGDMIQGCDANDTDKDKIITLQDKLIVQLESEVVQLKKENADLRRHARTSTAG